MPGRAGCAIIRVERTIVGATGIDGALEGLRLREEVVGHLFKLPAKRKMPTLACKWLPK